MICSHFVNILSVAYQLPTLIVTMAHASGNVCVYVDACYVCRPNVPKNTPIQSTLCCTRVPMNSNTHAAHGGSVSA